MTWARIAEEFGLSARQCQRAWRDYRRCLPTIVELDPVEVVKKPSTATTRQIEELAVLAETTSHDGTRLGALRARLDANNAHLSLLMAVGAAPPNLARVWLEVDARELAARAIAVLERHGVSEDVFDEIARSVETSCRQVERS